MRKCSILPVVAFILLAQGCASQTPSQTALDAHTAYNVVLSGLTEARRAGLISDQQKAQIEEVRKAAYASVLRLDDAALSDDRSGFDAAVKQYRAAFEPFRTWLLKVKPPSAEIK